MPDEMLDTPLLPAVTVAAPAPAAAPVIVVAPTRREALVRVLVAEGYALGTPNLDDMAAAADLVCEACGRRGMAYEAWRNPTAHRYHAIAYCPCGHATDF